MLFFVIIQLLEIEILIQRRKEELSKNENKNHSISLNDIRKTASSYKIKLFRGGTCQHYMVI